MLDIRREMALAEWAGYLAVAGTVVALAILCWSIFSHKRGSFVALRAGTATFSLVAMWFLAVDWSMFQEITCPDCYYRKNVFQYRVLSIPVSTQSKEYPTEVQLILNDLGVPCEHEESERLHRYRFWGLWYPAYPCINLTYLYEDTDRYTAELAARVRELGEDDPQLAKQLHDQIVLHRDYEEFWDTFNKLTGGLADWPE